MRNSRGMVFAHLIRICLLLKLTAVSESKNPYSECIYNRYSAVCLGDNIKQRQCQSCRLKAFPPLTSAENCLLLKRNLIEQFPEQLDSIRQLVTIDLSENRIKSLPDDLHILSNLTILDVSNNQLRSLSSKTQFPSSLRGLLLAGNQMTTMPAGINIPGLFVIDLSNNYFTDVPSHFCVSEQLIRVDLSENPLTYDLSRYIDTLNRCKNVNGIPFCVYTVRQDYRCDCSGLVPVFLEQPSFCMGTQIRGKNIKCNSTTSLNSYTEDSLFDVGHRTDVIHSNCSHFLESRRNRAIDLQIDIAAFLLSVVLLQITM